MDSGRPAKKQKSSGGKLDLISMLPPELLVLIISFLPFKYALRTSTLSKRWRNLYRGVKNISFKESEMVDYPSSDESEIFKYFFHDVDHDQRSECVDYMVDWVSRYSGGVIESFELSFSDPYVFESDIKLLIEFAASKKVKNLVLDFSDRDWFDVDDATNEEENMIELPECVYKLISLENLKLFACRFDPSRLANLGSIKSLYFGWIPLENITSLLSKTPLLECLDIKYCWNVGLDAITGYNNRLSELVLNNCGFSVNTTKLDLPMIQIFKYYGKFHHFEFKNVNKTLKEVTLDFYEETEYTEATRRQLCLLLHDLFSAKTVTVCPFFLQLVDDSEELVIGKPKLQTKQLILNTNLEPREFIGIRFMLINCPYLETLSFQLVTTTPLEMEDQFDPDIYAEMFWRFKLSHKCLRKTLKHIEMRGFNGGRYQLQWLEFLLRYGLVLERVDLYLPPSSMMSLDEKFPAYVAAESLRSRFKNGLNKWKIYVH